MIMDFDPLNFRSKLNFVPCKVSQENLKLIGKRWLVDKFKNTDPKFLT